jgi:hypothetical protein
VQKRLEGPPCDRRSHRDSGNGDIAERAPEPTSPIRPLAFAIRNPEEVVSEWLNTVDDDDAFAATAWEIARAILAHPHNQQIGGIFVPRIGTAILDFKQKYNLSKKKKLRDGLSGVVRIGNTLWVANDEMISLERLNAQGRRDDGTYLYGDHEQFNLSDYIALPVPPPSDPQKIVEADMEGLDYSDGYLWLVGSHSLKREKAEAKESVEENFKHLAKVSSDGNRFLLARIPVVAEKGTYTLTKEIEQHGRKRTAAQLQGDEKSSTLIQALAQDKHLQPFLSIPSKDNGFDIEGLVAVGDRIFIGLRGPVLRGWAVILEAALKEDENKASTLQLKKIGPEDRDYRKHFLQLGGLGVRDLCVRGPDLLILAGPTMDLDGPVTLFRWPGGARPEGECLIFADRLPVIMDVPCGQGKNKGMDHAEGMTLFGGDARSVLIVYDSVPEDRKQGDNGVVVDIFALPE